MWTSSKNMLYVSSVDLYIVITTVFKQVGPESIQKVVITFNTVITLMKHVEHLVVRNF